MHVGEGERRIQCFRHMLSVSVPTTSSSSVAAVPPITSYSFSKDGRKICVGDCALFKPPQDSPPFIGIIRWLTLGKEENISLSVNWLYRPADIKLGKGTLPEAAPNELFYSFHKDEIPAASLLHPCKVAFLRKGVELPFGISSFVCRRVYDIENRSLWWLTDNDYVNERQEEVNQLLDKTRQEMYGALQSGGRSPKPSNGPSGTQQLRHSSESVQTGTSPLPSQVRGKRRDRGDQGFDTIKRECVFGTDDTESGQFRPEHILKSEIAKITDKGGLIDFKGVEKFVHLMQPDRTEKKIDLACRIMLVDVIAVTDSFDCLGWFVQLKGLPVLDEWLQEIHKGKVGDGSSPKESDKSVEDFLLALLRALDKLPVNLHALQTSNVGKSVNHLRSHKNSEIQRKARSLVDLWKKRVEAEMNVIDAKSGLSRGGSWPSKSVLEEVSHAGNRRNGGPSELSAKSSTTQSSACKASVKLGSGEAVAKIALESPGSTKSEASLISLGGATAKDPNSATTLVGGGTSDLSTIKEEKSSSSSQSQNNSQSCSSDHANTRSSTAGSASVSKISGSASRHQKSSKGLQGSTVSGVQNETRSGKFTSLSRNLASEKASPTSGTSERLPDVPLVDHGNSQRLIVRLPSNCRSPACSANGGSFDDPTATLINASPLAHSENLDHHDRKGKGTNDALLASGASNVNSDLCQGRDGLVRSDEGNVYSPGAPCNEHIRAAEDGDKLSEMSKDTASSLGVTTKPGKSYGASFSSMNALIESCVKFSEPGETALVGDDNGMNLLANVAAEEMSKFDVSPLGSPGRKSPIPEDFCSGNDVKLRNLDEDTARSGNLPADELNDGAMTEQDNSVDCLCLKNESQHDVKPLSTNFSVDGKAISFGCEEKTGECSGQLNSSTIDLQQSTNGSYLKSDGKFVQVIDSSVDFSSKNVTKKDKVEGEGADHLHAHIKSGAVRMRINGLSTKLKARSLFSDEDKKVDDADEKIVRSSIVIFPEAASMKVEKDSNEKSHICLPLEMCREDKSAVHTDSDCVSLNEQKPPITANIHLESIGGKSEDTLLPSGSVAVVCLEMKAEKSNDMDAGSQIEQSEKQNIDVHPSILDQNEESGENLEIKVVPGHCPEGATPHEEPSRIPVRQTEQCLKSSRGKLDGIETGGSGKCPSNANTSVPLRSHTVVKLDFDLNEGFPVDGGGHGTTVSVAGNSSSVHFPCPLPFPISSMSASYPASITVASAAKGPFVPPQNPLSKGEIGWKGSAATSAFRPAEPRKVLEMPLSTSNLPPVDNIMSKQGRRPLDFDLNVPDQRVLEDVAYQNSSQFTCLEPGPLDRHGVGFDLDLNKIDESPDCGQFSVGFSGKLEIPQLSNRSSLSGGFFKAELNASRDFDLNNGPGPDEGATEIVPHLKGNLPFLSQIPAVRMNNTAEQGNFSSWFPPSNSYSAIAIPSILPGRGEQSYPIVPSTGSPRILGPPTVGTSFGPEFYRGAALSSSSAVPFLPAAPFQYGAFPFETNFPMSSNLYSGSSTASMDSSSGGPLYFSSIPPQLLVPSGVLSSHCPRSYVMNLPGGTSHVGSESRKWGGQALDLNTGPGVTNVERRDDRLSSALRQLPIPASQASVDEQIKMYQMAAGVLKRKEPDSGRDGDRISYKQPSWQ